MRVMIVGGGGREHAIAWKLRQSPRLRELYCAPGNAGIAGLAELVPLRDTDIEGLSAYAEEKRIDLVVVGPEAPLAAGLVDRLTERGIAAFGPTRAAAAIESSKSFAKELMQSAGIATASAAEFTDLDEALDHLKGRVMPVVIKADGLAAGKGVVIATAKEEAERALRAMLQDEIYGQAGRKVLIEDFMEGREISVFGICDGKNVVTLTPARDHKRVFDGDRGPNTGGMGAFSPVPDLPAGFLEQVRANVLQPAIDALADRGMPFCGVLYAGLMLTRQGPKVLEFNARFGDPETQVVLPLYPGDLLDLLQAAAEHSLPLHVPLEPLAGARAAVSIVMASGGYPGKYETGKTIHGLDKLAGQDDLMVFHAGTRLDAAGRVLTSGGRVLNVVAWAGDLPAARQKAYQAAQHIDFEGIHYRRDIAATIAAYDA